MKKKYFPAFLSQSNASVERFHEKLEMRKAHLTENPNVDPLTAVPYAVICYNNTMGLLL